MDIKVFYCVEHTAKSWFVGKLSEILNITAVKNTKCSFRKCFMPLASIKHQRLSSNMHSRYQEANDQWHVEKS